MNGDKDPREDLIGNASNPGTADTAADANTQNGPTDPREQKAKSYGNSGQ